MHTPPPRVVATVAALGLLSQLEVRYGRLLLFQSGGCCDGSTPMCYAQGDFLTGDADICVGFAGETPLYMTPELFSYWQNCQIVLDVADGRGGMFSLDSGTGKRFITQSRLFSDAELAALAATTITASPSHAAR